MKNNFVLKHLAEKLSLKESGGNISRLTSVLAKSSINLNPHQIQAAIYAFNSPLARGAILADEVGLGKTIEAGIIISQLWSEDKKRILIITPANLRKQWQDELSSLFGLDSIVVDTKSFDTEVSDGRLTPLTEQGIFIISYHFAYKKIGLIERQNWNVVVIDEAHRLRNVWKGRDASKMAYSIRDAIQDKPKLLLTATPLQNNLMELYGLSSYIDDKILGTKYSFFHRFVEPIQTGNEGKLKQLSNIIKGSPEEQDYDISGVLTRTLRKQVEEYVSFTKRQSVTNDFTPTEKEQILYDKVSSYLQRDRLAAIRTAQRSLMILVYRKLLASSSFAIAQTINKLIMFLENELKFRNSQKAEVENIKIDELVDSGVEEEYEESLTKSDYHVDKEEFTEKEIQKEIDELGSYLNLAESIKENTKGIALIAGLKKIFLEAKQKNWPQKAVVYTESRRTQEYLARILKENGFTYTIFNGENNYPDARKIYKEWQRKFPADANEGSSSANLRQALINNFKDKTQILLSTEAGAEGLNLQFCNIIVNYDLPWNPQRVEQRIGRCHRYGQTLDVVVMNFLNTKNYADQRVLELLQDKLHLFDGLFGISDEILGNMEAGIDFERRILEIYQNCRTKEEIDDAFKKIQGEKVFKISKSLKRIKSSITENFDESVQKLFKETQIDTKNELDELEKDLLSFCSEYFGNKFKPIDGHVFELLHNDKKIKIAFRDLSEDEEGKIFRASKELKPIKAAIKDGLKIATKPIPCLTYQYEPKKHFSLIKERVDKEGYLFLYKLKIFGIEEFEVLIPMVFLEEDEKLKPEPLELGQELLESMPIQESNNISKLPLSKEDALRSWSKWKEKALAKYHKRNELLYDREVNRINNYYKDFALKEETKVSKLEEKKKDLQRRKDNSTDFSERREIERKIRNIELDIDRNLVIITKLKQKALREKSKEVDNLDKKFELKTEEELIAVAKFKIEG